MKGYLGDEEETAKVIQNIEGKDWAISGDLGHMDEEGYLYVDGREKNVIIGPDGFKIAPFEIANIISKHPEVKECSVFGVRNNSFEYGDKPIAYIELKERIRSKHEESKIVSEIKELCEKELSSYYRPAAYYVGRIIMTPMMKEDTKAMKAAYEKEENMGAIKKLVLGSKVYK